MMGCACVDTGFKQAHTHTTRVLAHYLNVSSTKQHVKNFVVQIGVNHVVPKSEGRPRHKWGRYGGERRCTHRSVASWNWRSEAARDLTS